MAQMLIKRKANVNARCKRDGRTPIVNTLRDYMTRVDFRWARYIRQSYLLQDLPEESTEDLPEDILEKENIYGMSIRSGCREKDWDKSLLKLFVDHEASLQDARPGLSILYQAVGSRDEKAVRFLLQHCHVDVDEGRYTRDGITETPLHLALERQSYHICLLLLRAGANASLLCRKPFQSVWDSLEVAENVSTLHVYAASAFSDRFCGWDEQLLSSLLESGGKHVLNTRLIADNSEAILDGATCLHVFALIGFQQDEAALCMGRLVREGADVNVSNFIGQTPLHFAFETANFSLAIALVHLGADLTIKDNEGRMAQDLVKETDEFDEFDDVPDELKKALRFLKLWEARK